MKPFELDMPSDRRAAYDGKIRSDEWAAVRDEILFRDGNKCKICGCPHNLQVHHINYDSFLDENNLVTLCKPCHEIITKAVNTAREMKVNVEFPKKLSVWKWHDEEMRCIRMLESAIYHAYREIVSDTILELWKRTLNENHGVNLRWLKAMQNAGDIIINSIEGQTGLRDFGGVNYVMFTDEKINEYIARAYDHYASEGISDSEFARMFRMKPEKIRNVKRNLERIRSGGENGG